MFRDHVLDETVSRRFVILDSGQQFNSELATNKLCEGMYNHCSIGGGF
jgi:hypothetical protein